MIPHTKSFKRLKDEIQTVLDFAIVVSYAVPSLKIVLGQLGENDPLPFSPDHFDSRPIPTKKVRSNLAGYKEALSRHIFLSSFSYFEAYFVDVLKEVIDFHTKEHLFLKHSLSKNKLINDKDSLRSIKKLREYPVSANKDSYLNNGRKLAASGFVFPSSVLARHGLMKLVEDAKSEKIKSVDIPSLVESVFQLELDPVVEKKKFDDFRKMRNSIAHGRPKKASLHLAKAIEANNFLRNLALKIDSHVVHNLLLVEM